MGEWSPKIVAFLCNWCSYAGADLAGTGRNQYPPNIRVIRIPCSGRINPIYIIKALLEGADGVMVSGCHPGDCHYLVGNYYARRRFVVLKKLLTTAGIDPDRLHFTWVSASEGARFADVIKEITENVSALGRSVIENPPVGFATGNHDMDKESGYSQACDLSDLPTRNDCCIKQLEDLLPLCKKLLEDGTVTSVIGFQEGGETGLSIPYIFDSFDEADKLTWNDRCVPNLSGYLREMSGKTAIVAKPCDARAIINLIKEKQLKRENIYIIGMTCDGMVNNEGHPLPCCKDCNVRIPPIYDVLIGKTNETKPYSNPDSDPDTNQTFERFTREMQKCILCFSCRQSCYGCYCNTCFIDRGEPDWQTPSPDMGTKMLYHLGRAMHLSGRCVECGACENACASGVDIRYLISAVTNFIKDTYDYRTGMDLETEPAMLTYKTDDKEIGFLHYHNTKDIDDTGGDLNG